MLVRSSRNTEDDANRDLNSSRRRITYTSVDDLPYIPVEGKEGSVVGLPCLERRTVIMMPLGCTEVYNAGIMFAIALTYVM